MQGRAEGLRRPDGKRASLRHSSRGHGGPGYRAHRSGTDPDRSGLRFQQESVNLGAALFPGRDWTGQAGGPEEGKFRRPRSAGAGSKTRRPRAATGWAGSELDRGGSAVRQDRNAAAGAGNGFSRGGTRISRRAAGRESDLDDLVADLEKNDRVGLSQQGKRGARVNAEPGVNRGSGAENSVGEDCATAVFQSAAEDGSGNKIKARLFRGELRDAVNHGVKRVAVQQFSLQNHDADSLRIANIVERVGVQQNQVRTLTGLDGALHLLPAKKFRGIFGRRLQCLYWRK